MQRKRVIEFVCMCVSIPAVEGREQGHNQQADEEGHHREVDYQLVKRNEIQSKFREGKERWRGEKGEG